MRRVEGSVSVILALTITMVLSFCMVLIESARENTLLLASDVAFDTAVQCVLAEYHRALWEEYDLLYVDCSYGTELPDYELVKTHLEKYVTRNISVDGGLWLSLEYEGVTMGDVTLATDHGGCDFYLQAVEAAKSRTGISYIEQALSWLEQAEETSDISRRLQEEKDSVGATIEEIDGTEVLVREAVWGKNKKGEDILLKEAEYQRVELENPLSRIKVGKYLLESVMGESVTISEVHEDISSLASHRELASGDTSEPADDGGLLEKAFFCKYVMDHFSSYADGEHSERNLDYGVEYIIGGYDNDMSNLAAVVGKLLLIREVDNFLLLQQDEVRMAEAKAIALGAATVAQVPWLEPVLTQALVLYWAYEDSVEDLRLLLNGGEVPLAKCIPVEGVKNFSLDYEEYLLILLMMQGKERITLRTMDVIELREREHQVFFRMDACWSGALLEGYFRDSYDKRYTVTKRLSYY